VYLGSSAVLSLYSIRRMSGLVLSSGEAITHCVPVYDGAELPQSTLQLDLHSVIRQLVLLFPDR
jgi:actin-related protein